MKQCCSQHSPVTSEWKKQSFSSTSGDDPQRVPNPVSCTYYIVYYIIIYRDGPRGSVSVPEIKVLAERHRQTKQDDQHRYLRRCEGCPRGSEKRYRDVRCKGQETVAEDTASRPSVQFVRVVVPDLRPGELPEQESESVRRGPGRDGSADQAEQCAFQQYACICRNLAPGTVHQVQCRVGRGFGNQSAYALYSSSECAMCAHTYRFWPGMSVRTSVLFRIRCCIYINEEETWRSPWIKGFSCLFQKKFLSLHRKTEKKATKQ